MSLSSFVSFLLMRPYTDLSCPTTLSYVTHQMWPPRLLHTRRAVSQLPTRSQLACAAPATEQLAGTTRRVPFLSRSTSSCGRHMLARPLRFHIHIKALSLSIVFKLTGFSTRLSSAPVIDDLLEEDRISTPAASTRTGHTYSVCRRNPSRHCLPKFHLICWCQTLLGPLGACSSLWVWCRRYKSGSPSVTCHSRTL